MKLSNVSKVVSAGVVAASLAVVPFTLSAQAQNNAPGTSAPDQNNSSGTSGQVQTADYNNDFDWGWLGLLGLAGLAGLLPKKRQETVHYTNNEPDVVTRPRSDYR